ncbi:folate family ECF transporter S component [Lacrimispora saccharolytica]|nr:folate family ECF transporter S component [Lacrimispora saccharolytica]
MSKNPSNSEKKQNMFLSSSQELKKVPVLAVCAMFAALALILNSVASINIGPYIKIGFSAIPNQLVDYLFGPVTGSLFAGILDIVKYVMKPDGAFFFGFTFNAMLAAFIYGCFYYKKKLTLRRVLLAKLIVVLVVNVLLSTLWLDMLYGKGFLVLLPARAVKNLIMWPIDSVIFFALTRLIEQTGVFRIFRTTAR